MSVAPRNWYIRAREACAREEIKLESPPYFSASAVLRALAARLPEELCASPEIQGAFRPPDVQPSPELFPLICGLRNLLRGSAAYEYSRMALRVHSAEAPPDCLSDWGIRFVRAFWLDGSVWQNNDGRWIRRSDLHTNAEPDLAIVSPTKGLYDDLRLEGTHFWPDNLPPSSADAIEKMYSALELIRSFDHELHRDLLDVVRCIVLLPPDTRRLRHSFSCRTSYYGVIFIGATDRPLLQVAEDLVHEYYHQRFWGWWELESDRDLHCSQLTVRSPFTNRLRPFNVMLQAACVHSTALKIEQHTCPGSPKERWRRFAKHRTLLERLDAGTGISRIGDAILAELSSEHHDDLQ